ncbi:MAG: transglycosylase SLT domain-containing protein [Pikeienuella sp.]
MRLSAIAAIALPLVIGACASSTDPSVSMRAQGDACALFAEQPEWYHATRQAAERWGVPVELQLAIIWRESSFRSDVRPPKKYRLGFIPAGHVSSAYGYAQAIDGTWDWYREETGNRNADRTDFEDAADFVGLYVNKTVRSNDIQVFDAFNQYLNYHEGHTGFRRGDWQQKDWLQRAAREVAEQAARYRGQLARCAPGLSVT